MATMGLPLYVGQTPAVSRTAASVRVFLDADAHVSLGADVAVDVPGLAGLPAPEPEGARRAGLRLEGFHRPLVEHLVRDHPAQVALERHVVDHHEPAAVDDPDGAAVGPVVAEVGLGDEAQRAGLGRERRGCVEGLAQRAGDDLVAEARPGGRRGRAARDGPRGARTLHRVLVGAAELDGAQAAAQVHADHRVVDVGERDAGVVVLEDVLVDPAVLGVAVGAPLRHAHPVSPAVTLDGERVLHGERGGRAGDRQQDEEDEGAGERELAPAPGAPTVRRRARAGSGMWGVGSAWAPEAPGPPGSRIPLPARAGQTCVRPS